MYGHVVSECMWSVIATGDHGGARGVYIHTCVGEGGVHRLYNTMGQNGFGLLSLNLCMAMCYTCQLVTWSFSCTRDCGGRDLYIL